MYARVYAALNSFEFCEQAICDGLQYQFGSREFWAGYFLGSSTVGDPQSLINMVQQFIANRHEMLTKSQRWLSTIRSDTDDKLATPMKIFSTLHSDIPGNFPVIVGIFPQEEAVLTRPIVSRFEVRVTAPVGLADFGYLEVPLREVNQVQARLHELDIALHVIPMECMELAARDMSFAELVAARV